MKFINKFVYNFCIYLSFLMFILNPLFLICLIINGFDFIGLVKEMFYGGV